MNSIQIYLALRKFAFGILKANCTFIQFAFRIPKANCTNVQFAFGILKANCIKVQFAFRIPKANCIIMKFAFGILKTNCISILYRICTFQNALSTKHAVRVCPKYDFASSQILLSTNWSFLHKN